MDSWKPCRTCRGDGIVYPDNVPERSVVCSACEGVGRFYKEDSVAEEEAVEARTVYEHMFGEDRKNSIAVMGQNGDSVHMWDPDNPTEVEIAQSVWDKYKEKKYKAFQMDISGDQGVQIDEFDPQAKAIIFVPQMQGG